MRREFTGEIKLAAVLATGTLLASECFATCFKCDADHAAACKGVCTGVRGVWDSPVDTPERAQYVPPVKKRPMKRNNLMSAQHRILVSALACTLAALASAATSGVDDPEAAAPASIAAQPAPPPAPAPAPHTSTLDTTVGGMN